MPEHPEPARLSKEFEFEAQKLGIAVRDRNAQTASSKYVPTAFNGDTFVGWTLMPGEVQSRFQLTVRFSKTS